MCCLSWLAIILMHWWHAIDRECFPTHWSAIYFLTTRGHHCPTLETDIISLMLVVISKFPLRTVRITDRVSHAKIQDIPKLGTYCQWESVKQLPQILRWMKLTWLPKTSGWWCSDWHWCLTEQVPGFESIRLWLFRAKFLCSLCDRVLRVSPDIQRHACLRLNGNSKWVMGVSVSVTAGVSSSPLITLNWKVDCTFTSTREETCKPPKSDP